MTLRALCYCMTLVVLALLTGCNPCVEVIWSTSASPDGKWIAVTVMRNCGATTSEVLSVNVRPAGKPKLLAENNALVLKHGYAVNTTWQDASTVLIECRECVPKEITAKRDSVGPVHVVYSLPK